MSYVISDALAFGVPVPLEVWTAQSTLGQASPQTGIPDPQARSDGSLPQWVLTAAGAQTSGTTVEVQVTEPGYPPLSGVAVREAADTYWRGRDTVLARARTEPLQAGGAPLPSRLKPHGVALPSGARIVAFTRQISGGAYAVVVAYRSATATSWSTSVVVSGLSTTALPYPTLVVMDQGVQLFHYVIDDVGDTANVDVYQTLDEGATWARSARAVLQTNSIDLTAYTLGRLRGAYKSGQLLLLAGVTSTDALADPREFVNQYASADGGAHCIQISQSEYLAFPDVVVYDGRFCCAFANEATSFLVARFIANAYTDLSTTPDDTPTAVWDEAFTFADNAMVTIATNVVTDCDHALAAGENALWWVARAASAAGGSEESCQAMRIVGPIANRDIHHMGKDASIASTYGAWWIQDAGAAATDYPVGFCAWTWRGALQVACNLVSNSANWDDQLFLTDLGGNSTVTSPYVRQTVIDYFMASMLRTYWGATSLPTVARYGWTATGAGTADVTTTAGWLRIDTTANQKYYTYTKTPNEYEIRASYFLRRVSGGVIGTGDIACGIRLGQAALGFEVEIWFSSTQARLRDINAGTDVATVSLDTTGGVYVLLALDETGACFAAVAAARTDGARIYQILSNGTAVTDDGGGGGTDNVYMFGNRRSGTAISEWAEVGTWWSGTTADPYTLSGGFTNPDDLYPIPLAATASTYAAENVNIRARGGRMLLGDTVEVPADAGTPQRALIPRGYEDSSRELRGGEYPSPRAGCIATATTGRWSFRVPTALEQRFPRGLLLFDLQRANFGTCQIEGYVSGAWATIGTWAGQVTGLSFAREGNRIRPTGTSATYLRTNELADIGYVKLVSGLTTWVAPVYRNSGGIWTAAGTSPLPTIDLDPASTGLSTAPTSGTMTIYYGRGTLVVPTAVDVQYEGFCVRFTTAPDIYEATPRLGKFSACEAWCVRGADWGTTRSSETNAEIEELNNGATRGRIQAPIRDVRETPFVRVLLDGAKQAGLDWKVQTSGIVVGLDGNEVEILNGMLYELGQGTRTGVYVPYIAADGGTRTLVSAEAGVYGRPSVDELPFSLESGTEGTRYQSGPRLMWRGEL